MLNAWSCRNNIPEPAETHVETGRDHWVDFHRWQQLLQVVGHLATVTAEKRDERLEGIACVFIRDQLLRPGELLIEEATSAPVRR